MSVRIENRCVGCGPFCRGDSCSKRNEKVCYCDKCGAEISFDEAYDYDGMDVCEDCLKNICKKEW